MRKVILSLACAACAISASAQRASSSSFFSTEKVDNPLTIGIRAGGNLSTFTGDFLNDVGLKSRFGFNVGVNFDYSIMKCFGVQTGVYFTTKGAKVERETFHTDDIYTRTWEYNPMYIQIPVLASFRYNLNDNWRWELNAGPYFAFGVGGKYKYERTTTSIHDGDVIQHQESEQDFFGDDIKSFDMGIALGTGLTYKKFYFGVQYEIGMTDMNNAKDDPDYASIKNNNFTFSVGYNF